MSWRDIIAAGVVVFAGTAILLGLVGAVLHFEERTRPAGAKPWCLPCPKETP